jgi:HD superfamily phosphohydrolase
MYLDSIKNDEIKKYFNILSNEYPTFIDKYIQTKEMQRLSGIGQFCGCDYTKLHSCKYWYSRLEHSVACALMTWSFTKNKEQTLGALFHDLGTPAFSHCIDFLLNDSVNQESSEKDVGEIILSSKEIMQYLKQDNIDVNNVVKIEKYTIVENKKPKLCVDRLEGVLHTGLVWCHFWNIEDIKVIYDGISVLINNEKECEIGFDSITIADKFYDGVYKYSMVLQQNEDKFTMQFISDIIKQLIEKKIISVQDLYIMSEKDIIMIINNISDLQIKWDKFCKTDKLVRTDKKPVDKYYISVDAKKRYVIPLIEIEGKTNRLNTVSDKCSKLLNKYLSYKDSSYAYINF